MIYLNFNKWLEHGKIKKGTHKKWKRITFKGKWTPFIIRVIKEKYK